MSISFSTISSVFIEFVNETFIPIIDKSKSNYSVCIQKWQQFIDNVLKQISNFHSEEDLRQRLNLILHKSTLKQRSQKCPEDKPQNLFVQRPSLIRVTFADTQKNKSTKQQDSNKNQKQRQETIQFRDRKTSLDEFSSKKDKKQQSQVKQRKQQRSGSVNLPNSTDGDQMSEMQLIMTTPTQNESKHRNSSYTRKDNEVMSFNSISDFHKSRNNISAARSKQPKQSEAGQVKLLSKKSIQDLGSSSTHNKPNSYSSNYIESIKKISHEGRSPNQKPKIPHKELEGCQDFVQTTPVKHIQGGQIGGSTLSNIKKKISEGSEYVGSPSLGPTDSFGKFLSSFKKLCNTFESNHHKLMREDFNNKYINC